MDIKGLSADSLQGDKAYIRFFDELKGGKNTFDVSDTPDIAPLLFAASMLFGGGTFKGAKRLMYKETDRISAMKDELIKFGGELCLNGDTAAVKCDCIKKPDCAVSSHGDHRIAMALTFLLSITGGCIEDALCVSKSYPDYFSDIKGLGIKVKLCEDKK